MPTGPTANDPTPLTPDATAHVLPDRNLIDRPVVEIMSRPIFAVVADLRLGDALAAMVRTGLRHLGVVDSEGRCLGVVGDRAVAAAWAADPSALSYLPVRRLLDPRPGVVSSEATVGDVARTMHAERIDAVAVIDRTGRPVGMVTGGDLIGLMAARRHDPASTRGDQHGS
jgi:CBS domain-containing protein